MKFIDFLNEAKSNNPYILGYIDTKVGELAFDDIILAYADGDKDPGNTEVVDIVLYGDFDTEGEYELPTRNSPGVDDLSYKNLNINARVFRDYVESELNDDERAYIKRVEKTVKMINDGDTTTLNHIEELLKDQVIYWLIDKYVERLADEYDHY